MGIQLEQLVLFERDEMLVKLSWNWACTYVGVEIYKVYLSFLKSK